MTDDGGTGGGGPGPPRPATAPGPWRPSRLWHPGTPAGQAPAPGWGPLPELLLALTIVTGLVDAVSILALGRVFVANMTGNVVFVGFAIVGAPGFSLSASLFALAGFLVGAVLGGTVATRLGHDRAEHLRAVAAAELLLVAVALVVAATSGAPSVSHGTLHLPGASGATALAFSGPVADVLALLLATAMGVQNAAARKLSVPDLTTTVLTMTLTGIGADAKAGHRGQLVFGRRLVVVATMLGGGILGAWLVLQVSPVAALALAAFVLLVTTAIAVAAARAPAAWRAGG
ncbi:MAG TPA: YoaK family protein [Trebonia sp.]|nr:YoaK family protein [Trebonia sp.]